MSGDIGVVLLSTMGGDSGGEFPPVAIGSSFTAVLIKDAKDVLIAGGEIVQVCMAHSLPGSFLICSNAGGGVGVGVGTGGLGDGFLEPEGDRARMFILLFGVPPAETSV